MAGCGDSKRNDCRFGDSRELARPLYLDDLALSGRNRIWSTREGTFLAVDANEPAGVLDRCDGGLALAERDGGGLLVACLRRGDSTTSPPDPGEAVLYALSAGEVQQVWELGEGGRDAEGIALAAAEERAIVAWHSAPPGGWSVQLAEVDLAHDRVSPARTVSNPERSAGAPSLLRRGDQTHVVYAESFRAGTFGFAELFVASVDDPLAAPRSIGEVSVPNPRPRIVRFGRREKLFFRDLRRPSTRTSLYVQSLDDDLEPESEPRRIGAADAGEDYAVATCPRFNAILTPAKWGSNEAVVALRFWNDDLSRAVAPLEVYEWAARLDQMDATCADQGLWALVARASRADPDPRRAEGAVFDLEVRCRDDD